MKHSDPITSPIALSISTFRFNSIFPHSHARGPKPPVWQEIKPSRRHFFSADPRRKKSIGDSESQFVESQFSRFYRVVSCNRQSDTFPKTTHPTNTLKGCSLYFGTRYIKLKNRYNTLKTCHINVLWQNH